MNLKDYLTECAERAYHFNAWWGYDWIIDDHATFRRISLNCCQDIEDATSEDGEESSWFLLLCGEALSDE